ncbi:hypothetical protein CKM354_000787500 [Cercospora kikuchii]|uniref:Uncharacterized protein n=1 Tax=Cercospora kikuchii TaxID=84275 RepID=A0A9P3FJ36_9PEZI|nr:uncharacterized protein CKM354_000787500 [Cercospora kikuchii]GIZ44684.1 hypothetical protein CKM354_000787500 [Cercospora kikuchii]
MFLLWALAAAIVSGQHAENHTQGAISTATTNTANITSAFLSLNAPQTTAAPPCCWFAGFSDGDLGVRGNFYYNSSVVQTVATVFSTIVDYGDSEEVANVSTKYMAEDEIFTRYGGWIFNDWDRYADWSLAKSSLSRLGVPGTLVQGRSYAATNVYQPGSTEEFNAPYPTPRLAWNAVQVWYNASSSCGSKKTESLSSRPPVATRTVSSTVRSDPFYVFGLDSIWIDSDVPGAYTSRTITGTGGTYTSRHFYIQTLSLDAPELNEYNHYLPSEAIERYLSFQTSAYPWITDCIPMDTPGEPTVHIAVNHPTETSRVTVMMARFQTDAKTQPQPQATGDASQPPMTPTLSPSADNGHEPLPVQSPGVAVSKSASNSVPIVPPQSATTLSVSDVATIRDQTTRDQQSSNTSEGASSVFVSPTTAPFPATSSPGKPGSSQDGQISADNAGNDNLTGPKVVSPGDISASTAVQEDTLANTATSEPLATTVLDETSDPIVTVSTSISASSIVEIGTKERTTASQTSIRVVADESKPSEGGGDNESRPSSGRKDNESEGAAGSVSNGTTATASGTGVPDMTTLPDQGTNIHATVNVGSVESGRVTSTAGSSAATDGMRDAIMSGLGQLGTRNGSTGYTGPAYTGSAPGMMVNIVVAASLGLTWLAWGCM